MKTYLVGGYVRDQLLKRAAHEKDWVVVGANPQDLLSQGYEPVGKSFPVFLHPKTHEEYALARTEKKTGVGHTAFDCDSRPSVTLEEDLKRRDLTINAIAMDDSGHLIDPYHGQADLQNRVLRHVSGAFVEDPLRVLRVARFCAQLSEYAFIVAPETLMLMKTIVKAGELQTLSAERIWNEVEKALKSPNPLLFFETLQACDADQVLFPKLDLTALHQAIKITRDPVILFAALMHQDPVRLKAPKEYQTLAELTQRFANIIFQAKDLNVDGLLSLLLKTDALRRPGRFEQLLFVCEAIDPQAKSSYLLLANTQQHLLHLDLSEITSQPTPNDIKIKAIEAARLDCIQKLTSKAS